MPKILCAKSASEFCQSIGDEALPKKVQFCSFGHFGCRQKKRQTAVCNADYIALRVFEIMAFPLNKDCSLPQSFSLGLKSRNSRWGYE